MAGWTRRGWPGLRVLAGRHHHGRSIVSTAHLLSFERPCLDWNDMSSSWFLNTLPGVTLLKKHWTGFGARIVCCDKLGQSPGQSQLTLPLITYHIHATVKRVSSLSVRRLISLRARRLSELLDKPDHGHRSSSRLHGKHTVAENVTSILVGFRAR